MLTQEFPAVCGFVQSSCAGEEIFAMRLVLLELLAFLGTSSALDCQAEGIGWLDHTYTLTNSTQTPPSVTDFEVYVNPCGAVKGDDQCADDDHLCVVESITEGTGRSAKTIITGVKPFGSRTQGAVEEISREFQKITVEYKGALWGSSTIDGTIEIACGPEDSATVEMNQPLNYKVYLKSEKMCTKGKNPGESPDKNPKTPETGGSKKGGWGFFTWMFVLLLLVGIGYAALTVYINFAQSRGNLPLAADIGDVLRDLPYLLRDIFRKLNFMGSRNSSSGYAAL